MIHSTWFGELLLNTLIGLCPVKVCYITSKYRLELLLVEDQQVFQAFLADTPRNQASEITFSTFILMIYSTENSSVNVVRLHPPISEGKQMSKQEDIYTTLHISKDEAKTGFTRTLDLPGGQKVDVVVRPGTQQSLEIWLEDQSTSSPTKDSPPTLTITIADTPIKANHYWKASFEVAILVALAAVFCLGLALFLTGNFLPFLIPPIVTIGGLLALIGTLGLSSLGKLWTIFTK